MKRALEKKIAIVLFSSVTILGFFGMYNHYWEAFNFSAAGVVVEAKWNTANHNMSLFTIENNAGKRKKFHFSKVILKPEQIKVGDRFRKKAGSKNCFINELEVQCVR